MFYIMQVFRYLAIFFVGPQRLVWTYPFDGCMDDLTAHNEKENRSWKINFYWGYYSLWKWLIENVIDWLIPIASYIDSDTPVYAGKCRTLNGARKIEYSGKFSF